MNTFQQFTRSVAEPVLTVVVSLGIVLITMAIVEPKYFTHPSHYIETIPDELIISPVNEMPSCHERVDRYIMSAGEVRAQKVDPKVSIMFCGGR